MYIRCMNVYCFQFITFFIKYSKLDVGRKKKKAKKERQRHFSTTILMQNYVILRHQYGIFRVESLVLSRAENDLRAWSETFSLIPTALKQTSDDGVDTGGSTVAIL